MIRNIVHLEALLALPCRDANESDVPLLQDMADTLLAHEESCAGLAANMLGVRVRAIAFFDNNRHVRTMFNPEVVQGAGEYEAEEGCLSLDGVRTAKRFKRIRVRFQDETMRWHEEPFEGFTAQVIQHEIDHTNGVVI